MREVMLSKHLANRLEARRFDEPRRVTDRGVRYTKFYDLGGGRTWSQSFSAASKRELDFSNGAHGLRHSYAQNRIIQKWEIHRCHFADYVKNWMVSSWRRMAFSHHRRYGRLSPSRILARRQFSIDKASKEAIDKCRSLTLEAFVKEQRAKGFLEEANALHIELPQLRKEAKLARGKIFNMSLSAKDLQGRYEELRQKAESLERELVKAKSKIRRLDRKSDSGKGKTD